MKIIYLHQYFNTPEMSGGTRSYEMARRMVEAGHEVHIITSFREQDAGFKGWSETCEAGIKVHWCPVPYSKEMNYRQRVKSFILFAVEAGKRASEIDADVVFATSTPLTIALPAVKAARKQKVPLVFEVRDLWPEMPIAMGVLKNPLLRFAAHKLERWAYKNSSVVVALSPGMKAGVVRTGFLSSKVAVIPNSSDNEEFLFNYDAAVKFRAERQWLGDRPLLVYTGTFGKVNDVAYMVDVAKELLEIGSNVRILLVGQGAERDAVIQYAKKEGVYDVNLFVEKALPKNKIPALLSAATMASAIFVDLPEMRANSANKFFDSLASGTPIFINYGGWMHDLVKANQCGLAMWGASVHEVASSLHDKMNDENWLNSAGNSARRLAEECFARDDLAQQLLLVLESAVNGVPESAEKIAPGIYD